MLQNGNSVIFICNCIVPKIQSSSFAAFFLSGHCIGYTTSKRYRKLMLQQRNIHKLVGHNLRSCNYIILEGNFCVVDNRVGSLATDNGCDNGN